MSRHLSQFLAVRKETVHLYTEARSTIQKLFARSTVFNGSTRIYRPKDENGEQDAPKSVPGQTRGTDVYQQLDSVIRQFVDTIATCEYGEAQARASVVVDGMVILRDAPAIFLIQFERFLDELITLVKQTPLLDVSEHWTFNAEQNCYISDEVLIGRTKKMPRPIVKAEATDRFPAQVDMWTDDVTVGFYHEVKRSSALPAKTVDDLVARLHKLKQHVTFAREEANRADVELQTVAETVLAYLRLPVSYTQS